ncbi:hypothetical protein Pla144_40170 [Bythopirellula polymerisocia]|uniref:Uncharacterized protein n=1 Tax=Bythopirellula polymerisocia TaxID=2528003 RepID=A0A5C6CGQ9_9BACT|nr:hypothetical protein Pla144_40170 [Bythopirellula polymerisocia]
MNFEDNSYPGLAVPPEEVHRKQKLIYFLGVSPSSITFQ